MAKLKDHDGCGYSVIVGKQEIVGADPNTNRVQLLSYRDAKVIADAFNNSDTIDRAIAMAIQYGGIDGAHHKTWVIDQTLRILAGDRYGEIIKAARDGEDGPNTYSWDCGIAP